LAHKRVHKAIAEELERDHLEINKERNLRGLVPLQMNHKKLVGGDGVDLEPDYVFIVQKLRAPLLIDGLKDLKIDYKTFTCKYKIHNRLS
jgi:hypothetical protein